MAKDRSSNKKSGARKRSGKKPKSKSSAKQDDDTPERSKIGMCWLLVSELSLKSYQTLLIEKYRTCTLKSCRY